MNSPLWALVPDSALPLIIVGVALALMIGIIKPRRAMSIVGMIIVCIIAEPFINALFDALPTWLNLLITIAFVLSMVRAGIRLLLGNRATDHMVGILAADVVRLFFRILFFPFRLLGRLVAR
jgi:hypothetical protein